MGDRSVADVVYQSYLVAVEAAARSLLEVCRMAGGARSSLRRGEVAVSRLPSGRRLYIVVYLRVRDDEREVRCWTGFAPPTFPELWDGGYPLQGGLVEPEVERALRFEALTAAVGP